MMRVLMADRVVDSAFAKALWRLQTDIATRLPIVVLADASPAFPSLTQAGWSFKLLAI
jgi:hypothetical protein